MAARRQPANLFSHPVLRRRRAMPARQGSHRVAVRPALARAALTLCDGGRCVENDEVSGPHLRGREGVGVSAARRRSGSLSLCTGDGVAAYLHASSGVDLAGGVGPVEAGLLPHHRAARRARGPAAAEGRQWPRGRPGRGRSLVDGASASVGRGRASPLTNGGARTSRCCPNRSRSWSRDGREYPTGRPCAAPCHPWAYRPQELGYRFGHDLLAPTGGLEGDRRPGPAAA